MAVPYTFGTATASIPLSNLDSNFATTITLGNTAIQLGNTVTTLNNMTLANVTVSSGNVTFTNVSATTANVATANITTEVVGTSTITTAAITTANVTTANVSTALSYSGTLTGGTGVITIGTTQLTKDASGNVGINTSSPATKLDVNGAITALGGNSPTGGFNLRNVAGTVTPRLTNNIEDGTILRPGASGAYIAINNFANSSELLRFTDSGNVGIGTSSPSTYANGYGPVLVTGTGNNFATIQARTDGPSGSTNGISYGGSYSTNPINGARMFIGAAGASGQRGLIVFYTKNTDDNTNQPTERMRIAADGIVTMSAYGVGTATFSAAGVISSVSDETWKIKDGLPVDPDSMLKKLEPGYWYYNDEKKETFGADRQLGFYAQNVNAAIGPEAAPEPEEGKPWGYYDRSVLAVTVMSLQKALATIESLTARIAALEAK